MMDLVPNDEMVILGKELHDAGLLKIYGEVKRKIFEECSLRQWKHRMEDDERLRIGDERVVIDKNMFIQKDT